MGKSIIEELKAAYSTEITGFYFYTTAAVMVMDDRGKSVFSNLAKDELDHIRAISRIAESLENNLGWIGYEEALKQGRARSGGVPLFTHENELLKRLQTNQTDLNAVNIGMQAEEEAIEFYSTLLKKAVAPAEKVFLTSLLEMEKEHLKLLRWESESLLKSGSWCGEMEFSVEKEAD